MSEGIWPEVLIGDCRVLLDQLEPESVHSVITSPPYWNLRDYGTGTWEGGDPACGHVAKRNPAVIGSSSTLGVPADGGKRRIAEGNNYHEAYTQQYRTVCGKCGARRVDQQIGLEPTFAEHLEVLVDVFRRLRRCLRRDGILFVNYGDAYACSPNGRKAKDIVNDDRTFRDKPGNTTGSGFKAKDLMLMPHRLAIALQDDGWYVRSEIVWSKLNPLPESVTDRFTRSHEYVFMFTRSPHYFFDQEAVAERSFLPDDPTNIIPNGRRNRRSVWPLATQPLPFDHYAAFPEALVEPLVLCSTSERGCCPACGAPWRRVVEKEYYSSTYGDSRQADVTGSNDQKRRGQQYGTRAYGERKRLQVQATGWQPTCSCGREDTVPATILDPFCGSGTTLRVATKLGRKSIGIDLSEEYVNKIARKRTAQGGLGL